MAAVAVGLQVCCCNLESFFRVCISCAAHTTDGPSDGARHLHATSDTETAHDVGAPSDDHEHDAKCTCASHQVAKSAPQKRGFQAPDAGHFVALPPADSTDARPPMGAPLRASREPVYRPPMSLLGQRCALTL